MPLGNDLLMVALTARHNARLPYYAAMATAGSVIGCLIMDLIARKGGEQGLEKTLGGKRTEYVKRKVRKNAGWALAVASLMPPPFPFTPFVIAAAALEYPRRKLLSVIAITRLVRFSVEGVLAIVFGKRILQWAGSRTFQYAVVFLIVVAVLASVLSVLSWVRKSKARSNMAEWTRSRA